MRDAVLFIEDIDDCRAADRSDVERLATGGRVKGRAVEVDGSPIGGLIDDAGGEIAQVGVGVVETFGHRATAYFGRWAGLRKADGVRYIGRVEPRTTVRP